MTPEQEARIDAMSQYEMASMWRFSRCAEEPLLQGETGQYFSEVFQKKGGFTPEISKSLGWGRSRTMCRTTTATSS